MKSDAPAIPASRARQSARTEKRVQDLDGKRCHRLRSAEPRSHEILPYRYMKIMIFSALAGPGSPASQHQPASRRRAIDPSSLRVIDCKRDPRQRRWPVNPPRLTNHKNISLSRLCLYSGRPAGRRAGMVIHVHADDGLSSLCPPRRWSVPGVESKC